MRFELSDGTAVLIRPIRPDDKARLSDGLRRLSAETIRRRFLAAKPRFSAFELRYLTEVDGHDHIALVAVLEGQPDVLIAVARSVRLPDAPDTAEMAIVVGDPWHGKGLGRHLANLLADEARRHGIRHFAATMLGENEAAIRLMRRINARLEDERFVGGLREVTLDLAPASRDLAA
jgi:RimJ/RimL family protein N-acetyltransferase